MAHGVFVPARASDLALSFAASFDSAARGAVAYRGAALWQALAAGTAGQALLSGGPGADPAWGSAGVTDHGGLTGLGDDDHGQYALLAPAASARNVVQPTGAAVVPLTVRGHASQSVALTEWRNGSNVLQAEMSRTGNLAAKNAVVGHNFAANTGLVPSDENVMTLVGTDLSYLNWVAEVAAGSKYGQGEFLVYTYNPASSVPLLPLFGIGTFGFHMDAGSHSSGQWFLYNYNVFSHALQVDLATNQVNVGSGTFGGKLRVVNDGAAQVALAVRGAASQSANLQEWLTSAGAVLSTISENGYFTTRKTAAPADAELATSEAALWFDSTAGAARLMVKAKTSAGTVVTGSLALA